MKLTLIPKPDKDTIKKKKTNTIHKYFDEKRPKNSQQNFSQQNPTTNKKDHTPQPSGFIPGSIGWFNICKSINVIHCISKRKIKKHKIISIDAEKTFDEVQHAFMIKYSLTSTVKMFSQVSLPKE